MADVKISALTAATTLTDDDLLLGVDDPAGSPETKKITVSDFWTWLMAKVGTLTNKTFALSSNTLSGTTTELGAAMTDGKTGTGALVLKTSPTLVTPVIGVATGTSLAATSFCSVGATPATTGGWRSGNGTNGAIFMRDAGDTADVQMLRLSAIDAINIGQGGYDVTIYGGASKSITSAADTIRFLDGNAANSFLVINSSSAYFGPGVMPWISDSSGGQYYKFAVANLAADRTISLPLLTGNDTFVFNDFGATLTNKTINLSSNTLAFTSAQLATACTDETGTAGSLVFSNNPILTGPTVTTSLTMSGAAYQTFGSNPATDGFLRFTYATNTNVISAKDSVGNDRGFLRQSSADRWRVGDRTNWNLEVQGYQLDLWADSYIAITRPNGTALSMLANAGGCAFFTTGTGSYGGGVDVINISNAGTNPTSNPTGGGIMYSDGGAGKWRGSGGTVTTFGPAEPHCPTCGRDFALEHKNDDMGEHLALCLSCMIDTLSSAGVNISGFTMVNNRTKTKADWDTHMAAVAAKEEAAKEASRLAELSRVQ